jgi:adenylate cyclase
VDARPVSALASRRVPVALLAVLILLAAATSRTYLGFLWNTPVSPRPSLLVMPVTSAGSHGGDELLETGIADALIHHLASSRDITVRPLSATRSYSGTTSDPVEAGREQKVSTVLSASYQRADGKLRVLARLIDVQTAQTEELYRFDTGETAVFAIQDAIASDLGNRIASKLGAATVPVRVDGTSNAEAYRHYLHGIALYDFRNGPKAVESFERAIDLDPNYTRAWVGMAVALGALPTLGSSSPSELYEKTLHAVERALALDPGSADAYSALCGARLTYAHDWSGAAQACARAMELDPRSAIVLQGYSFFLVAEGRFDEAIRAVKIALDIEPRSVFSQQLHANALYLARRYDEAYGEYVRLNELQPDRLPTYEWMVRTLEASGREPEALRWLLRSLTIREADPDVVARVQRAYRDSGWPGVLRERLAMDDSGLSRFRQAGLHARLGNTDLAFELLNKAYEERSPVFVTLRVEPQLDSLRGDPRYAELVKRLQSGPR